MPYFVYCTHFSNIPETSQTHITQKPINQTICLQYIFLKILLRYIYRSSFDIIRHRQTYCIKIWIWSYGNSTVVMRFKAIDLLIALPPPLLNITTNISYITILCMCLWPPEDDSSHFCIPRLSFSSTADSNLSLLRWT